MAFPYHPVTASALCPACQLLAGAGWPSVDPSWFVWAWSPCLDPFLCLTSCSEGITCLRACMHAKSLQLCPNLCDHMDCSPPSSSVCGILQARILEWIVISSSSVSPWTRDQTRISCISCIGKCVLYHKCLLGSFHQPDFQCHERVHLFPSLT